MISDSFNGKYRLISEINMIPFIDVALVLLIIFMVMTPFLMKSQIKINVPESKSAQPVTPDKKTIDVQVQANGSVYLDGKKVSEDALQGALSSRIHDPQNQSVLIEADKKTAFEHVVSVMGIVKKLGVTKMGVSVIEEPAPRSRRH